MEETRIKPHSGPRIRRVHENDGNLPESRDSKPSFYYVFKILSVVIKIFATFVLIFSMQNSADIIRQLPFLNELQDFQAFLFSYFIIQITCNYIYVLYLGSFKKYVQSFFPTLVHLTGFLMFTIFVPLAFVIISGAVWWGSGRMPLLGTLSKPFQILPMFTRSLFERGMNLDLFILMSLFILAAMLFIVILLEWAAKNSIIKTSTGGTENAKA